MSCYETYYTSDGARRCTPEQECPDCQISSLEWRLSCLRSNNKELRRDRDAWKLTVESERKIQKALQKEVDRLTGKDFELEIQGLRKDAERYRWLMSNAVYNGTLGIADGWINFEFKDEAQKAIDAAMAREAQNGQS
ncbi:hypothetical protein [Pseudomonas sp. p1(2021b)]|uniref:hypothetical protein n=1 Tax=Pseudomonas sp. p1(2021b) TaxID=2874628 RepID=UPI003D2AA785